MSLCAVQADKTRFEAQPVRRPVPLLAQQSGLLPPTELQASEPIDILRTPFRCYTVGPFSPQEAPGEVREVFNGALAIDQFELSPVPLLQARMQRQTFLLVLALLPGAFWAFPKKPIIISPRQVHGRVSTSPLWASQGPVNVRIDLSSEDKLWLQRRYRVWSDHRGVSDCDSSSSGASSRQQPVRPHDATGGGGAASAGCRGRNRRLVRGAGAQRERLSGTHPLKSVASPPFLSDRLSPQPSFVQVVVREASDVVGGRLYSRRVKVLDDGTTFQVEHGFHGE
jgi:hypothetical protein